MPKNKNKETNPKKFNNDQLGENASEEISAELYDNQPRNKKEKKKKKQNK